MERKFTSNESQTLSGIKLTRCHSAVHIVMLVFYRNSSTKNGNLGESCSSVFAVKLQKRCEDDETLANISMGVDFCDTFL